MKNNLIKIIKIYFENLSNLLLSKIKTIKPAEILAHNSTNGTIIEKIKYNNNCFLSFGFKNIFISVKIHCFHINLNLTYQTLDLLF